MGNRSRRRMIRGGGRVGLPRALTLAGGRLNAYVCPTCGGHTITVDVDSGATPARFRCHARAVDVGQGLCDGIAESLGYPGPDAWPSGVRPVPDWEWHRPQGPELARIRKDAGPVWEHVSRGGLVLRRRRAGGGRS